MASSFSLKNFVFGLSVFAAVESSVAVAVNASTPFGKRQNDNPAAPGSVDGGWQAIPEPAGAWLHTDWKIGDSGVNMVSMQPT
jgi:hypothetical protein